MTMATIKSYTDIKQSRKLAEFLPYESADMGYYEYTSHIDGTPKVGYKEGITEGIPCWSLSSLLNYLRESDFFPNIEVNEHSITMNVSYYDEKEARPLAPIHNIKVEADTFVDACYELLLKLNEVNLL